MHKLKPEIAMYICIICMCVCVCAVFFFNIVQTAFVTRRRRGILGVNMCTKHYASLANAGGQDSAANSSSFPRMC